MKSSGRDLSVGDSGDGSGDDPRNGVNRTPFLAETVVVAVAGIAVLATARLGWISNGVGSTLDGRELADSLRNGALVPDGGKWIAGGMYLLVALGGLLLASSGFAGRVVASARLVIGTVVAAPFVFAALAGWFPLNRWALGPMLIVAACVVAVVVSVRQLARPRTTLTSTPRP